MIGRVLQVNRRGKKTKNLQGFKTGTLGLKWKHENKEKRGGRVLFWGKKITSSVLRRKKTEILKSDQKER